MEPETLIPLSVVTPGEEESALAELARPVIVLCGDIKQLPAIVSCDQAREGGLDVSLLERLMERPLYQETEKHITCLAINYRSHSGILWLPNTLFYNDRLKPCNAVPLSKWSGLPNPKLPILVKHIDGEDDWVEEVSHMTRHYRDVCALSSIRNRELAGSIKPKFESVVISFFRSSRNIDNRKSASLPLGESRFCIYEKSSVNRGSGMSISET